MAAVDLHHAIFTTEKTSNLPLRSASSFLHPAPERDGSPTSHLFASAAYQDLIQRQPTHPDGPTRGWDLGLNLLGDPMTAAEHKNLEDHQTKMKLRRLHAINIAFELLFGVCGTYTTVRYFLAFVDGSSDARHVCALVLGVLSALVVILVVISIFMPLFPTPSHPCVWRRTRTVLRAGYLLLLSAGAVMNLVLVLIWHPSQSCSWDIDILWYTSAAANNVISQCHPAPFSVWVAAAVSRLLVTCTMALSFVYTLRAYHKARHPTYEGHSSKYPPYSPTDSEDISRFSMSSPRHHLKSPLRLTQSQDSDRTLSQSNVTLPKSNSISTLAHSRSHSTPPPRYMKISPPTSRRTSVHVGTSRSETPSVNTTTESSSVSHTLRRSSRISLAKVTSDVTPPELASNPERVDCQTMIARDPSEMPSCPSWRPGHRGSGVHTDIKRTTLAWENASVSHASQSNGGSMTSSTGESISERDGEGFVCAYGYGACGPTYPYLDMYNPSRPATSCDDVDGHGILQGHRPVGPTFLDLASEPSLLAREEEEGTSSGDEREGEGEEGGEGEEEYIAMMGGFVRRMATIESLGSKEASGTLSTTTTRSNSNSAARHSSMRSKTSSSPYSSVRFVEYASSSLSPVPGSLSTAYLSFTSGGTGMWVNERGELLLGPNRTTAGSPCYYTASASSFPSMDDEDR